MIVKGLYVFEKTTVSSKMPIAVLIAPGLKAGTSLVGDNIVLSPGVYRVSDPATFAAKDPASIQLVDLDKGGGGLPDPPGKIVALFANQTVDQVKVQLKAVLDGQGDDVDI